MKRLWLLAVLPLVAAPSGNPSAIDPAGPAATAIADLTWFLVIVLAIIYGLTVTALGFAIARGWRSRGVPLPSPIPRERMSAFWVGAATVGSVIVLTLFVIASFVTDRKLLALERDPAVVITINAHQWWWEITYSDPVPAKGFVTANELHLPVGKAAKITLQSSDVIHSLWLPNISGKRDILPGRTETIWLTASETGVWRGRCAEFCGYQHARMQLDVIVESETEFERWRAAQVQPSRSPATPEEQRGQQVFSDYGCMVCHSVRGAPGSGYSGTAPDLTHLKSRQRIAAGILPNTKGYLAGWIADPQSQKPGVLMPLNLLPPGDFQALVTYLESLK
jgi:cytochrome c oxidase subunit II